MRLLVLGGTRFAGRHFVEAALAAGHSVALFNRGKTSPALFPRAEFIEGDRSGDLAALARGNWDAAVDFCGYYPNEVGASARLLRDAVGRYCFISSVSVYRDWAAPGQDESAPTAEPLDDRSQAMTGETYGRFKAACEREVREAFGERALVVRPGLIVGPHDPTDRFTYWPARLARDGEALAFRPERVVQVLDARDLAAWLVRLCMSGASGTFNACGEGVSFKTILDLCLGRASITAVSDEFLVREEVAAYSELPLWIPGIDDSFKSDAARQKGLRHRPLAATIKDTLDWDRGRPPGPRANGLSPEREARLLAAWKGENHGKVRSGPEAGETARLGAA